MQVRAQFAWAVWLLAGPSAVASSQPAGVLPQLSLSGTYKVGDIQVTCSGILSSLDSHQLIVRRDRVETPKYDLVLGPESAEIDAKDRRTITDYYDVPVWVFKHQEQNAPIGEIVLRCSSQGAFDDRFKPVGFSLTENASSEALTPTFPLFPLHSWDRDRQMISIDPVDSDDSTDTSEKSSKQGNTFSEGLKTSGGGLAMNVSSNLAQSMPIDIHLILINRAGDCWQKLGAQTDFVPGQTQEIRSLTVTSPKQNPTRVEIPADFKTWCALGSNVFDVAGSGTDAEADLNVVYTPTGGLERSQSVKFKVALKPPTLALLLGAFLGLVIGCSVHIIALRKKDRTSHRILKEVAIAIGAVIAAEAFCYVAMTLRKPNTFWGVNLDPRQLDPCFTIALLASGGTIIRRFLTDTKRGFGDDDEQRAEENTHHPEGGASLTGVGQ